MDESPLVLKILGMPNYVAGASQAFRGRLQDGQRITVEVPNQPDAEMTYL